MRFNEPAIALLGIHKTYPGSSGSPAVHALRGIDLTVDNGAIFCILGPNGAGKTTLVAILSGLLYADAGEGRVCRLNLFRDRRKIRGMINFASGHANFPDNFSVDEILNYFGMLYGLPKRERVRKSDQLTEYFELSDYRKVPFNQLSTGLKQRLALAKSLLNDPRILFLDEPTVGLDPKVALLIRKRLRLLNQERQTTIILTTHQMDEAEQMSERIGFLKDGRFVRMASAQELKRSISFEEQVTISGRNLEAASQQLQNVSGVSRIRISQQQISCRMDSRQKQLQPILRTLMLAGAVIEDISITQATLEDVFVALAEQSDSN